MKKILSLLLILTAALSISSCTRRYGGENVTSDTEPKQTVYVGDEYVEIPAEIKNISYGLPAGLEFVIKTANGDELDLYSATVDELEALSEKKCDKVFPSLQDKQDIANICASVFSELYPDKGVAHDGMTVTIKSNRDAKGLICHAKGADGGEACLAIDNHTGTIFMITYIAPDSITDGK